MLAIVLFYNYIVIWFWIPQSHNQFNKDNFQGIFRAKISINLKQVFLTLTMVITREHGLSQYHHGRLTRTCHMIRNTQTMSYHTTYKLVRAFVKCLFSTIVVYTASTGSALQSTKVGIQSIGEYPVVVDHSWSLPGSKQMIHATDAAKKQWIEAS